MKSFSWTVFLCSNNPGTCGQTHYSCSISWCDNEQQCVLLDYISNTLGCYETFHYISFHNICIPKLCNHIHYMSNSDHEKHFHIFALVSILKVSSEFALRCKYDFLMSSLLCYFEIFLPLCRWLTCNIISIF
jgi:hypothetical protein